MLHMLQYEYTPDPLNVTSGETIILMNFGPQDQSLPRDQWGEFTHSVTAVDGSFDMQNIPPDFQGRNLTAPATPGTYAYYCRYHGDATSGMRGTLIVDPVAMTSAPTPTSEDDRETPLGVLALIGGGAGAALLLRPRGRR